ncbi:pentapeptide repeat-containing protein [Cytophagaceae bacterium ABcell3]|nr:pentapeptide repeat-containing protein [Cytophagaceae bacterium ABcell3]
MEQQETAEGVSMKEVTLAGAITFNKWREEHLDQDIVIENLDLTKLDLSEMDFTGVIFENTDFSYCKMHESIFRGARISNCCFDFVNMHNCGFNGIKNLFVDAKKFPKYVSYKESPAEITHSWFQYADLKFSNFKGVLIKEVSFLGSNLEECCFE